MWNFSLQFIWLTTLFGVFFVCVVIHIPNIVAEEMQLLSWSFPFSCN